MPIRLVIDNLTCQRGMRAIFRNLSVVLVAGETLMLTGPNGAGKTTLLRALAGLLPPAEGTIHAQDAGMRVDTADLAHYLGHRDGVRASLTVAENATFWARYLGAEPHAADAALERLGIGALADIPAGYLSAGQRRRLGLCRLLVAHRPLWLLDEPTTSLDATARATLADLMVAHCGDGGIIVAATHVALGVPHARELVLGPEAAA